MIQLLLVWAIHVSLSYLIFHYKNYWRINRRHSSLIVSSKGMFVNNDSTSRPAIYRLWSWLTTSLAKSKKFFTVNSLVVSGDKIGFRYLANKYVGVFIADKIGLNFGVLLTTVLCTLGLPYKIPGVVPTGQILSNSFSEIFSSFLSTLKRSFSLLSKLTM